VEVATMLMNDPRAAAQAVNAMLTPKATAPKLTDRQVEEHPRCFLFGHYDSRGGATLIPAKHLFEAFARYATSFGFEKDSKGELQDEGMKQHFGDKAQYEAWLPDAIHALLEEDFMFSCTVLICDEKISGECCDLDEGFDDHGYKYGLVQYRWQHKHYEGSEELSEWCDLGQGTQKTLVFYKGEKPLLNAKALGMEYLKGLEVQLTDEDFGEDACGVVWMPKDEPQG